MLTLNLTRLWPSQNSVIGELDVAGVFQCYTLELPEGKCIPAGTYPITIYDSPRFKRPMPILNNVPGRSYIEIHFGNDAADTEGCILVGQVKGPLPDWIGNSVPAFNALFPLIQQAIPNGGCEITIQDSWQQDLDAVAAETTQAT